jgi:hypothetical protein
MIEQMLQNRNPPMTTDGDMNGMNMSGMGVGTFDQNFNNVPQDLWKMPMTLEWDWADMT